MILAILLGRLAISTAYPGKRPGGALAVDALAGGQASDTKVYALAVDARDAKAVRFCAHLGFEAVPNIPLRLLHRFWTDKGAIHHHNPSPRPRPNDQSMPPPGCMVPVTCCPRCGSSAGRQGTSWNPTPSSIMAKRPEASVTRSR